jgi:hypothetical protein
MLLHGAGFEPTQRDAAPFQAGHPIPPPPTQKGILGINEFCEGDRRVFNPFSVELRHSKASSSPPEPPPPADTATSPDGAAAPAPLPRAISNHSLPAKPPAGEELDLAVPEIGITMDAAEFQVMVDVISNLGAAPVRLLAWSLILIAYCGFWTSGGLSSSGLYDLVMSDKLSRGMAYGASVLIPKPACRAIIAGCCLACLADIGTYYRGGGFKVSSSSPGGIFLQLCGDLCKTLNLIGAR